MKVGRLLGLDEITWRSRPNGLYSVNFHRIGNSSETAFDPCVYSCTSEELDRHIKFFKQHFDIINPKTLPDLLDSDIRPSSRLMCLTFDDGYIDNFNDALPVLEANNVKASFFIATGLIGNSVVPWWDKVAYLIKNHKPRKLHLHINLLEQELLHQNGYPPAEFMDWHHLAALIDAGMELGAHSHNHDILTKLSADELFYELSHSKTLLETKLKCDISAFSYPVGNKSTYNKKVIEGLKNTGYKLAFNFQPGINTSPSQNPYDLHRFPIAPGMSSDDLKRMFSYAKRY